MTEPVHGLHAHVAVRCDDEYGHSHSWDVWRDGTCVESGFRTRREARERARQLDAGLPDVIDRACGRSNYLRAIADGEQRWSGSDLRGNARKWASRYAEQRRNLVARLEAQGAQCEQDTLPNRVVVLVVKYHGATAYLGAQS